MHLGELMHEEVQLLEPLLDPGLQAGDPLVDAPEVAVVQAVTHEAHEGPGSGQAHVNGVAPPQGVCDHRADAAAGQEREGLPGQGVAEPARVAQLHGQGQTRGEAQQVAAELGDAGGAEARGQLEKTDPEALAEDADTFGEGLGRFGGFAQTPLAHGPRQFGAEAEARRDLLAPAPQILLGRKRVVGGAELHGGESPGVVAQELHRGRVGRVEGTDPFPDAPTRGAEAQSGPWAGGLSGA